MKKPVELVIKETQEKIWELARTNGLGVSINRLILQNILNTLLAEEEHVIKKLQEEGAKDEPERG
mgnify:FL=1